MTTVARRPLWREIARPRVAIPLVVVLAAAGAGAVWSVNRTRSERATRETALPEIRRLVGQDRYVEALVAATNAGRVLKADPALADLRSQISVTRPIQSNPTGAKVSFRDTAFRADWHHVGDTPIKNAQLPRAMLRWKFEKPGFDTAEFIAPATGPVGVGMVELTKTGSVPADMVRIPRGGLSLTLVGYDYNKTIASAEYLIDRVEVTNKAFKAFVDAGGYTNRRYWKQEFVKDGRPLTWDEAMALFRDQTGRPGPSTWEVGSYPNGQDDLPVGGVSWYEAAAYAEFAGKSLPTVYHWARAGSLLLAADIAPFSNFGGKGPVRVGARPGITAFGVSDMAGNLKEWCWNEMDAGRTRYILGGAWNDPDYMFFWPDARSPFDRSATNGLRTVKYLTPESLPAATTIAIPRRARNYREVTPVSDEVFRVYRSLYAYDPSPLDPKTEKVDDSADGWRREKISFTAAYGQQRVVAHLFLPKRAKPPYQTVLFWPGSNVIRSGSSDEAAAQDLWIDFLVLSGRAVLWPVYLGTLERYDGHPSSWPETTRAYRDWVTRQINDARRAIDYLETRPDVDRKALGYYGISWGSRMGSIVLALEPRIRTAVFLSGGLSAGEAPPEVDVVNFSPRVSVPVLMVNGDADFIFHPEEAQKPLFQFLGTPSDQKKYVVLPGGHAIFADKRSQVIRETLDWYDRYLGKVQ